MPSSGGIFADSDGLEFDSWLGILACIIGCCVVQISMYSTLVTRRSQTNVRVRYVRSVVASFRYRLTRFSVQMRREKKKKKRGFGFSPHSQ